MPVADSSASSWTAMQGAGATMSAFSAFMGAVAQKQNLRFQADIAEINAQAAERTAQARLLAGQREEQSSLLATAQLKGRQTVGYAARGVDLGEGSAARTLASTDVMGKIDANTIAANAVREAWGYRAQATSYGMQATVQRGAATATSPMASASTSLLNSAAAVSTQWYQLKKAGAFDTPPAPSELPGNTSGSTYWGPF